MEHLPACSVNHFLKPPIDSFLITAVRHLLVVYSNIYHSMPRIHQILVWNQCYTLYIGNIWWVKPQFSTMIFTKISLLVHGIYSIANWYNDQCGSMKNKIEDDEWWIIFLILMKCIPHIHQVQAAAIFLWQTFFLAVMKWIHPSDKLYFIYRWGTFPSQLIISC